MYFTLRLNKSLLLTDKTTILIEWFYYQFRESQNFLYAKYLRQIFRENACFRRLITYHNESKINQPWENESVTQLLPSIKFQLPWTNQF